MSFELGSISLWKKLDRVDKSSSRAVDEMADILQAELEAKNADFTDTAALEEKYESLKTDLLDATRAYDSLLEKLHDILRKNGATEAQLTWNIYSNVEMNLLTGRKYYKVAEELYRKTRSILYYLAFLQVLNQYRNPDTEELTELNHIRKHYKVVVY